MKCITIQHKNVYDTLLSTGIYHASIDRVHENLKEPYLFMQKHFGWSNVPIFLAPVGYYAEISGAKFHNDPIVIELDIPDEVCKIQHFYDWTDFIFFMEFPDEFGNVFDTNVFRRLEDWGATIMDIKLSNHDKEAVQITAPYLKKEWITKVSTNVTLFQDYDCCGGRLKMISL